MTRAATIILSIMVAAGPRSAQAQPAAEVVVRPRAAPGPLDNPLKGWCVYTDAGKIVLPYSMVYRYVSWKELEPAEGRYAFEEWERKTWDVPEARGKHVVFRVYVDYPGKAPGLPPWLAAKGVRQTRYADHGGGLSPDYDDPNLVAGLARLIEALGRRYDNHPRVAFIEAGLLGFWGEWHTWPVEKLAPSKETERVVLEAYRKAFPRKVVMARLARDDAGRHDWLGFHDDLFPEDTDGDEPWTFLAALRRSGRTENWRRAAIGGEMVPNAARRWLGPDLDRTTEMIDRGHFSWIGPYGPALERSGSPEFRKRADALVRRMGYQFRIVEARHPAAIEPGGRFRFSLEIENEGVAPFYYPWPVELLILDRGRGVNGKIPIEVDIRGWVPGTNQVGVDLVAPELRAGTCTLALGIRDPWTGEPAIRFANNLRTAYGCALLSTVEVKPASK